MSDEKLVVELKYPIPIIKKGEKTELKFLTFPKRIKAKHLRGLPDSFYDKKGEGLTADELIPIIARLSGHSESVIGEVDVESDLVAIGEKLANFFGDSLVPESGKKLSGA